MRYSAGLRRCTGAALGDPRKNRSRKVEGGYPQNRMAHRFKTFRTKRDAEDWARRTEDEMVRGAYIQRAPRQHDREDAMNRYLAEYHRPNARASQSSDRKRSTILIEHLGKYSLAALTPEIIANFEMLG